jgi:hypothetical protein
LLIRAASRYTHNWMAARNGSPPRAPTVAAHAIDPRTLPDAAAFSPRFRAFYTAPR